MKLIQQWRLLLVALCFSKGQLINEKYDNAAINLLEAISKTLQALKHQVEYPTNGSIYD